MSDFVPRHWEGVIIADDGGEMSDNLRRDIVDMGIDTREKFMAWLATKGFSLEFYMKTPEWARAVEAYPWAKEMDNAPQEGS